MSQRTVSVAPGRLARWVGGFAERHGGVVEVTAVPDLPVGDRPPRRAADGVRVTAVRLVGGDGASADIVPPYGPVELPGVADSELLGSELLSELIGQLTAPGLIGIVLVRRGRFAAGVTAGSALLASKVGSRYVQSRTKAGGWSQQRYARRRAGQARKSAEAAADVAARLLGSYRGRLVALATGGDRTALRNVLADDRLRWAAELPTRHLNVAEPRLAVLREAVAQAVAVPITLTDPRAELSV